MNKLKQHHRLLALLLSMLLLVGMIPTTAISTGAAEADVAEDAAQADVAETGVAYQTLSGISAENLTFETSSTYPWTVVANSSPTALVSGNKGVHSSSSYLRVTAQTSGLLSFKYYVSSQSSDYFYFKKAVSGSGDNVEPSSGYLRRVYGNTSYDTYDKIKTRWQTTSSTNIQMDAGDFIVFSYKKNASTNSGGDCAWTSGFTFTALPKTTITFESNIPDHGWMSNSNTVTGAKKDSVTGLSTTSAGSFYAIPDIDNDYTFDGLYTDPSYADEYKVAPASYSFRAFSLTYPAEDITYYAKFSQRTSDSDVFFYVNYDDTKIKDVKYYRYSAFADTGELTYGSAISGNKIAVDPDEPITVKEDDLVYFEYSPADGLADNDIVYEGLYSGDTKVDYVYGGGGGIIGGGGNEVTIRMAAKPERNHDVITITVGSNDYTPIEGYDPPTYLDVTSRNTYKWVTDTLDDEDVIRSNNPQVEGSFSCLKIVPQISGTINFDFKAEISNQSFARVEKRNTDLTEDEATFIRMTLMYGGEIDPWTYMDFFMDEDDYDDWDEMYEAAEVECAVYQEYFDSTTFYGYSAGNWSPKSIHVEQGEELRIVFCINQSWYLDEFAYLKNLEFVPDSGPAHTLTFHNVSGQEGRGGMSTTQKTDSIVSTAKVFEGPAITLYGLASSKEYSFEGLYRDSALTQRIESSINDHDKDFVTLSYEDFTGDTDLWVNFIDNSYQPLSGYTAPGAIVKTRARHAWTVDSYGNLASGNSGIVGSGSYISFTAQQDGIFAAELKAPKGYINYLYVTVDGTEPTDFNNTKSWNNVSDWTLYTTQVQAGDEIRFAFLKVNDSYYSESTGDGTDVAYLRNVRVANGDMNYTIQAYDDQGDILESNNTVGLINYSVDNTSGDDVVNVSGDSDQVNKSFKAAAGLTVTLTAAPQPDGQFLRWVKVDPETGDKTLYSSNPVISFIASDDLTLHAVFTAYIDDEDAAAIIGSAKYGDVAEAINIAVPGETVIVLKGEHEMGDNATVKKGVTLLVPFDDEHTLYTTHTNSSEYTGGTTEGFSSSQITKTANAYSKLTIPEGVTLTVEDGGAVSISAKNISGYNNNNLVGPVAGKYGQIDLGGDIVLESGSKLYAWGFITGDGQVTAKAGSEVFEYFQIYDFRGGTITVYIVGAESNQFPFNQYYIQNIESKIKYEYGATEYVNMAIFAGGTITVAQAEFIGDNGVFVLSGDGTYLNRRYDAPNDKMYYEFSGSARIEDISMNVYVNISSEAYYLPINNIDITMKSGSTLELDKKVIFLPGSSLTLEEGATLTVEEGAGLVFAGEGIDKYSATGGTLMSPAHPVAFAASEDWTPRVVYNTSDKAAVNQSRMAAYVAANPATLNNNGTVIVEDGAALVSTEDSAAIYSSEGTGVFMINGENTLSDPLDRYVDSDNRTVLVNSEEVNLMNERPTDGVQSTADRWSDSIDAVFSMKDGVWGDWRTVTFCDAEGNAVSAPVVNVSLADKSNIHTYDGIIAWSAFDDEGKYWKYVENGDWTYEYLNPGVAGTETQLKALPANGTKTSVFEKHSLTLNGDVGVNFYVFDAPAGASMSYSWGNKYISDNNYSADESYTAVDDTIIADPNGTGYKVASVSVAPKEIGDEITVKMMLDGNVIAEHSYSAADYLNAIIGDDDKALAVCENNSAKAEALQALCTSMLQYGAACQNQFGYKTGALVSDDYMNVSPDFSGLTSSYETDYPAAGNGSVPGFTFMGYTMTLNSETVLDLVFKNESSDESPAFTVTGATPVRLSEGKYYMFDVTDIKINELLNNRTVTINDQNMTVNAGTYIYKAITTQQSNDTLMATMNNLYNYYLNATAFFALA